MTRHCLIHMTDLTPIPTKIACQPPSVHGIHAPPVNASDHIIGDFPELLIPHFKLSDTNKHGVEHHITAPSPHYMHVPATWMQTVSVTKAEFVKMEQVDIICCFSSLWASLLRVVRKPVGGWWSCRDCLNNATLDDHYSSPHIQDFNTNLAGTKIFTKLISSTATIRFQCYSQDCHYHPTSWHSLEHLLKRATSKSWSGFTKLWLVTLNIVAACMGWRVRAFLLVHLPLMFNTIIMFTYHPLIYHCIFQARIVTAFCNSVWQGECQAVCVSLGTIAIVARNPPTSAYIRADVGEIGPFLGVSGCWLKSDHLYTPLLVIVISSNIFYAQACYCNFL